METWQRKIRIEDEESTKGAYVTDLKELKEHILSWGFKGLISDIFSLFPQQTIPPTGIGIKF